MSDDFKNRVESAKQRLPLPQLMAQYGFHANARHQFKECPFCHHPDSAGLFRQGAGQWFFKCHHTSCVSGTAVKAFEEVGFLGYQLGLSWNEAAIQFLKMTGLWREAEVVRAGKPPRKRAQPKAGPDTVRNVAGADRLKAGLQTSPSTLLTDESAVPPNSSGAAEPTQGNELNPAALGESDVEEGSALEAGAVGNSPGIGGDVTRAPGRDLHPASGAAGSGGSEEESSVSQSSVTGGGGGSDDPPLGGDGPFDSDDLPLRALRDFYEALGLIDGDVNELWHKRGLTAETAASAGFKTNQRSNKAILENVGEHYDKSALVEAGLWVAYETKSGVRHKPNEFLYGKGVVGKAEHEEEEEEEEGEEDRDQKTEIRNRRSAVRKYEYGWREDGQCNPMLIPYFDAGGELIHLRPHKFGLKGVGARLFVARTAREREKPCRVVVVTEGEYKAWALKQVLNWERAEPVAVAAMPGINMAKNWDVMFDLKEWLLAIRAVKIYIAYDNEDRSDRADETQRYESEVWARYLAIVLSKEGYDARVTLIPAEWRDAKGKADWDGVLGAKVAGRPVEAWPELAGKISEDWFKVFQASLPADKIRQALLFGSEEERIIQNRLGRLFHKAHLPHGGEKEKELGRKLKRLAVTELRGVAGVERLGDKYLATVGWYYETQPMRRQPDLEKAYEQRQRAVESNQRSLVWYLDLKLKGAPDLVGDFKMKTHFRLVKPDGDRDRLVTMRNIHGEKTKLVPLDSKSMTAPRDWRHWLAKQGGFTWLKGEQPLQALQLDVNHESAFREVIQIVAWGEDPDCKLWFFGDGAFSSDGKLVPMDKWGIFWWDGLGYYVGEKGKDGQAFRQPKPLMHPKLELVSTPSGYGLAEGVEDAAVVRDFFQEVSYLLFQSLGSDDAYLALGQIFSYAAAREIFRGYGGFPGCWFSGEKGHGKTTVVKWLMEFHGFHGMESGLGLLGNSSVPGIQIAAEQFSNLAAWLDEFRDHAIGPEKRSIIHSGFNREPPSKWAADGVMRKIRTSFLVSGESTSSDAATRSRYPHVPISQALRLPKLDGLDGPERERAAGEQLRHYEWLQNHRQFFFCLFRFVLRRRPQFVAATLAALEEWQRTVTVAADERARFVHGVSWAGLVGFLSLFPEMIQTIDLARFRRHLIHHCAMAAREVESQVNVNEFWTDLLSAWKNGAFGDLPGEWRRFFTVRKREAGYPPGAPNQNGKVWYSTLLYLAPQGVIDALKKWKRASGRELALQRNDLLTQMQGKAYFVRPTRPAGNPQHKQKFGGKEAETAWCIDLDRHELGYIPVSDEEYQQSMFQDGDVNGGLFLASEEWVDPRRGDLFALVSALERRGVDEGK